MKRFGCIAPILLVIFFLIFAQRFGPFCGTIYCCGFWVAAGIIGGMTSQDGQKRKNAFDF